MNLKTHKLLILLTLSATAFSGCQILNYDRSDNDKKPESKPDIRVGTAPRSANPDDVKITILHTNDHHGRFWKNSDGEYGMAARKTLVDQIRESVAKANGCTLLLSGGDINTGVPESDIQDAVPDFKGMNLLGYDAMAVGNHEFDNKLETFFMQEDIANFPFLSANVYSPKNRECIANNNCSDVPKRIVKPYLISDKCAGLKIGLLGLTTSETRSTYQEFDKLDFRNPITEANSILPELKKNTDIIIALTHMGHYSLPEEKEKMGDIRLANETNGIDVIVGGHSQEPLFEPDMQNGTIILQAHEWGKYLGRLDLNYNIKTKKLTMDRYGLLPVNLKAVNVATGETDFALPEIKEDPEMIALLQPYQDRGQDELLVRIGEIDQGLDGSRATVRNGPAPIAEMINTAILDKTKADIAIFNGGGIRDSLPGGVLSYRSTLMIHPFGNTLTTVELTEAELRKIMQSAVEQVQPNNGAYPHLKGITVKLNSDGAVSEMNVAGVRTNANKKYKIAMSSYMAGETYGDLTPNKHPSFYDTGYTMALSLRDYIEANTPLEAAKYETVKSFIIE